MKPREARVKCPKHTVKDSTLLGCGSTNVIGPDSEGFYDCLNCGLLFKVRAMPADLCLPAELKLAPGDAGSDRAVTIILRGTVWAEAVRRYNLHETMSNERLKQGEIIAGQRADEAQLSKTFAPLGRGGHRGQRRLH